MIIFPYWRIQRKKNRTKNRKNNGMCIRNEIFQFQSFFIVSVYDWKWCTDRIQYFLFCFENKYFPKHETRHKLQFTVNPFDARSSRWRQAVASSDRKRYYYFIAFAPKGSLYIQFVQDTQVGYTSFFFFFLKIFFLLYRFNLENISI